MNTEPVCQGCPADLAGLACPARESAYRRHGGYGKHPHPRYCQLHAADPARWDRQIVREAEKDAAGPPAPIPADRPRRNDRILIRSHLYAHGGYGQIAEWLGRGLVGLGYNVAYDVLGRDERYLDLPAFVADRIDPDPADAWELLLAPPMTAPHPGRKTVFFSMWEVEGLPADGVSHYNAAAMLIVPSTWNAAMCARAGVTVPIRAVPMGVSAAEGYEVRDSPRPPADRFVVGTAGRMAHGGDRKGLVQAGRAFVDAFPAADFPEVELRVKCFDDCLPKLKAMPRDRRIQVNPWAMPPAEMADWSRCCTVGLYMTCGEGWGLHLHQFMAVGRPILAPASTAVADYFDGRHGWELPFEMVPARDFYAGQGDWAEPTHDGAVAALRAAHADWKAGGPQVRLKGEAAARRAAEFTWRRTAEGLRECLVHAGMVPPPPKPHLAAGPFVTPVPDGGGDWYDPARAIRLLTDFSVADRQEMSQCAYKTVREACCGPTSACSLGPTRNRGGRHFTTDCVRCLDLGLGPQSPRLASSDVGP